MRLTELSDESWAAVGAAREGLLGRSLLCGSADYGRQAAGMVASVCEVSEGVSPRVVWCDGPLSVLLLSVLCSDGVQVNSQFAVQLAVQLGGHLGVRLGGQLREQLDGQLGAQLGAQLRGQLRGQLDGQLDGQLRGHLDGHLDDQLDDQLYAQLAGQLAGQLREQLADQFGEQLDSQLREQLAVQFAVQLYVRLGGQLDDQLAAQLGEHHKASISWGWRLAWIQHWLTINELPEISPVDPQLKTKAEAWRDALECHYWIPGEHVIFATRQHTELHLDNQGRLHNETGPAWEWADGTAVYALDGIRVPAWVCDSEQLTAERIFGDELGNTEQRRVAAKLFGWGRLVDYLGTPIDVHDDPFVGALYRLPDSMIDDDGEGGATLLVARNASPHLDGSWETYGLLASPDARSVVEAQASLASLPVDVWVAEFVGAS